jgi:carbon storage regulator CsrA
MLVLTRTPGEAIVIMDQVTGDIVATVEIVSIGSAGKVRLGFEAERRYGIHREEVWESISQGG